MKIAIFGMGYVGCVSAVCLAKEGHSVIGVDVSSEKINLINSGISPIIEADITGLISEMVSSGRLKAVMDPVEAVKNTELCFVCVGTPSKENGDIEQLYIERVSEDIGLCLRKIERYYTVVYRSTIFPGTMESTIIPILEKKSGKKAGKNFGICFIPEFLREGNSFYDFYHPPKTVIGSFDQYSCDILQGLFSFVNGPFFQTPIKVAEMIKYIDNAYHALKIGFANEVGTLCKKLNVDSWEVMDIFCADHKLNISTAYFRPGFAFGGPCLPKDLKSLNYKAKMVDSELPILRSILVSNEIQISNVFKRILSLQKKRIGFLGLSFKEGTDDLRESPIVTLIEYLLGKGLEIAIYDKNIDILKLVGTNRGYLEKHIPHIASLIKDRAKDVISSSDIIVVGHKSDEFKDLIYKIDREVIVFDLVRAIGNDMPKNIQYEGISW